MEAPDSAPVEIANIVGSGDLDIEIDLAAVAATDEFPGHHLIQDVEHSRRKGNRLLIDFEQTDALGILAPSGVYVITGASSFDELKTSKTDLLEVLESIGLIADASNDGGFEVQNLVCTGDLGTELYLNQVVIHLGLEKTEYEPEQFPGVVYRPDESSSTILVFGSGKVVVTGARSIEEAVDVFELVETDLQQVLSTEL